MIMMMIRRMIIGWYGLMVVACVKQEVDRFVEDVFYLIFLCENV